MEVTSIIQQLTARGIRLEREGDTLLAIPKEALTNELRQLIREHKPELLQALTPSERDKDFFRAILPDPRIARHVGADAEERRAKVLAQMNEPNTRRALAISPDGLLTVGVRVDGKVWTQDLRIPPEKFDPWLILEAFERATQ